MSTEQTKTQAPEFGDTILETIGQLLCSANELMVGAQAKMAEAHRSDQHANACREQASQAIERATFLRRAARGQLRHLAGVDNG